MKKLILMLCLGIALIGCNDIGGNGASISAAVTSGNCSNFTESGQTCVITITYNTNGVSSPSLSYTPNPLPAAITNNGTFNTTFGTCQTQVSNSPSGQYTCPVTITYTSNAGGANFNLVFTLSSATSNPILVSGN